MSNRDLGSKRDQDTLRPLLIEGRSFREAMRLLGWTFARVSEASRAINGQPSDTREGREGRQRKGVARRVNPKREAIHAALREAAARNRAAAR